MRFKYILVCSVFAGLLSACGGGGPVASTPAPTPSPAPTNTSLTNLKYDQSFTNDAAGLSAVWDLNTQTEISSRAHSSTLSIEYDAGTNGYTITTEGYTQDFLPADKISSDEYETVYDTGDGRLTLTAKGYAGGLVTQYVRMGLLQVNEVDGTTQNTNLTSFTYGLPTSASATPRTGSATYRTEAFGAVTAPGKEPMSFQGEGQLDIDFALGAFSGHTYLSEASLVSDDGVSGGGIELTTAGTLSASDASLRGTAIYEGRYGQVATDLAGSLYGPAGQELGATFSGQNARGMSVTGSIVGQQDSTLTPTNLSFANMTQQQLFYLSMGQFMGGQLNWQNSETFTYSGYASDESGGQFTITDKIEGRVDFTTYRKAVKNDYYGTQEVTLELYRAGANDTSLPLTYASFGHWEGSLPDSYEGPASHWFIYGFTTPDYALDKRTGSASYEGIVYGTGTRSGGERYDVTGTSSLAVDFGSDTFSGALQLAGRETTTDAQVDFGAASFSGTLTNGSSTLVGDFEGMGAIYGQFFGPDGQEVAGTFSYETPDTSPLPGTSINGAFAALPR